MTVDLSYRQIESYRATSELFLTLLHKVLKINDIKQVNGIFTLMARIMRVLRVYSIMYTYYTCVFSNLNS